MKLMIAIVPKGISRNLTDIISEKTINFQTITPGSGTAPTEVLDYLSLGETEKDVIFSIVDDDDVKPIFEALTKELDFLNHGKGVAFTVGMDGISKQAYKYLYSESKEQ